MGSNIPRTDVRIRMGDDDIFDPDPKFFSSDLGDHRLRALSHIGRAGDHIDGSEVVDFYDGTATIRFIDPGPSTDMDH